MHDQVGWRRLGLDEEEWRECQLAAMEMSIATPGTITPHQVAVEFALARAFDGDPVLPAHAPARRATPHARAAIGEERRSPNALRYVSFVIRMHSSW